MSTYLLDTCVISDFVKGEPGTLISLKNHSPADLYVSTLTTFEIDYGLALNPVRAKKIGPLLKSIIQSVTVLPLTAEAGSIAANIRANLRQLGTPIGPYDVLIAGVALSSGLTLVTANTNEFSRVNGLLLESWRR